MAKTVVGLMESSAEAQSVMNDLMNVCGCSRSDIGLMARGEQHAGAPGEEHSSGEVASGAVKGAGTGAAVGGILGLVAGAASLAIPGIGPIIAAGPIASALAGAGIGAAAGGIIGALANIGVPEEEAHYYAEGVRRGGTLITVRAASDPSAECAARVMKEHGAVDIDERAGQWKQQGWSGSFGEGDVIPVAKEELAVGKRQVEKGGVRVYSEVQETPVEETVNLREEQAKVERRPVDRPLAAGDQAFQEKSIEVNETAEEPVVEKRGRVVEEVRVGKESAQRQRTVRDKVRSTEVHVENQGERMSASSRYNGPERRKSISSSYTGVERRMSAR
jgi:uncharacterized protein (TIGR02271 family)